MEQKEQSRWPGAGTEGVLDAEGLLAQMGWVRRLALGLAGDPNEADDVAQETWLAAQVGALGQRWHPAQLRAWLQRVARRKARDARRSRARRSSREEAAARAEEQPSSAEVVERGALQREVAQAVLDLPEPYRSTLLYRYLDELTVEEVARRTECSAAAVRQRLVRGRRLLRERLERSLPDGLHAGLAVLLGKDMAAPGKVISTALTRRALWSSAIGAGALAGAATLLNSGAPPQNTPPPATELSEPPASSAPMAFAPPSAQIESEETGPNVVHGSGSPPDSTPFRGTVGSATSVQDYRAWVVENEDGTTVEAEVEDEIIVVETPPVPSPTEKP